VGHVRAGWVVPASVRVMTREMVDRGRYGEGFHIEESGALGMRRLAIIDVEHGNQPLYNEDRDVAVIFNGEIYNHGEIRALLHERGHRLVSASDGAVLPHLYEEFGERFVEHLNGIFAIALWDAKAGVLLLARDRIGVKP